MAAIPESVQAAVDGSGDALKIVGVGQFVAMLPFPSARRPFGGCNFDAVSAAIRLIGIADQIEPQLFADSSVGVFSGDLQKTAATIAKPVAWTCVAV